MTSFKVLFGAAVALIMITKSQAQENGYGHEEYAYPKYTFEYQVKDDYTKDIKSQHETRDGHTVKGFYSLLQPDGKTRTVQYTADEKQGFNAIVNYEGGSYVQSAPQSYSAPEPKQAAPEISYSAPQQSYESPLYSRLAYAKASVSTPHFSYSY